MKEQKTGRPLGIGVSEAEMAAITKRIADKVSERLVAAMSQSFHADPQTGEIMISLGALFEE